MAVFSYNGVTLPYAEIVAFTEEAIYDESGTDWISSKFVIEIQSAVINFNYLDQIRSDLILANGSPASVNSADIMGAVRARLMRPRRELYVQFNGVNLIPRVAGVRGSVDSINGPKPIFCTITEMTNQTFLVHYRIEAQYWAGDIRTQTNESPLNSNLNGNIIVSHRWSEEVDIDENHYTTRTRRGKIVIRSDNSDGAIPNDVRTMLQNLGIPRQFIRKRSHYRVTPDGLGMEYEISDQEVYKKPPEPAFTARGSYTESVSRAVALRYGECRVGLKGDTATVQTLLLRTAISVCASKILRRGRNVAGGRLNNKMVIEGASVNMNLYDNDVECVIRAMYAAPKARINGIAAFAGMGSFVPFSDETNYTPPHRVFGSNNSKFLLQAAAYYDPSLLANGINLDGQLEAGTEVGKAGINPEA